MIRENGSRRAVLKTVAYSLLGGSLIGQASARERESLSNSRAAKGITGTVDSPLSRDEIEETRKSVFSQASDRESTTVAASMNNGKPIVGYAAIANDGVLNEHYEIVSMGEMHGVEISVSGAERDSTVKEMQPTGRGIEESHSVS